MAGIEPKISFGIGCRNCAHNCCCQCLDGNCGLCNGDPTGVRCCYAAYYYKAKFACFTCRRSWKAKGSNNYGKPTRPCPGCGATATILPTNARPPSPTDERGWELFRKLHFGEGLVPRPGTLANVWTSGVGSALHQTRELKRLLVMPTKLRDYPEWVTYMNTTKYNGPALTLIVDTGSSS